MKRWNSPRRGRASDSSTEGCVQKGSATRVVNYRSNLFRYSDHERSLVSPHMAMTNATELDTGHEKSDLFLSGIAGIR